VKSFISTPARALSLRRRALYLRAGYEDLYLHAGESFISAPATNSSVSMMATPLHDGMMYNFKCRYWVVNTKQYCKLTPTFRKNKLPQFSGSKMETACISEMLGSTYNSYNRTDNYLNTMRREDLQNITTCFLFS
jgi:hypothetical protein